MSDLILIKSDARHIPLKDCSIDSIVCDPPYGLKFMGKGWDRGVPGVAFWVEALRVAKPGAYLLAFGGTRTVHRLVCAIEDAGWEIRDMIAWVYGSGFPKSLDVSKAIDKAAGAEREVVGVSSGPNASRYTGERYSEKRVTAFGVVQDQPELTAPYTDAAKEWSGYGTALKPAMEPICVARKPLIGTVAENVLRYGTGGINVDGCRVSLDGGYKCGANGRPSQTRLPDGYDSARANQHSDVGRWPANLIHDGSEEVVGLFPNTKSGEPGIKHGGNTGTAYGSESRKPGTQMNGFGDSGSAARFFYCAKASREDRNEGCEELKKKPLYWSSGEQSPGTFQSDGTDRSSQNFHPTVKPTSLMRYLVRLVTPPGGIVLDQFCGSGSTGKAAAKEGFRFIGCDTDQEYLEISRKRIEAESRQIRMF